MWCNLGRICEAATSAWRVAQLLFAERQQSQVSAPTTTNRAIGIRDAAAIINAARLVLRGIILRR
jgi:hypothetical protein